MMVIPAIDLMDGKCVRLVQGRRENKIIYSKNPLQLAQVYCEQGAEIIHVIDLNCAFNGSMENFDTIKALASRFPIQIGGGIRSEERIKALLAAGVKKIILSTILIKNFQLSAKLKEKYYGRIIGSFDFKDGKICCSGWTDQTSANFDELSKGFQEIIVTDTNRDGTLSGPNLELLKYVKSFCTSRIIYAGGLSSLADIKMLKEFGIHGAIVGRSVLDGKMSLKEAIICSQKE